MANCVVLGLQWGDEGKGKIVDLFTPSFDIVARSQGGHNAGHTVYVNGQKIILHLIPSGILHPNKLCLVGNGVVLEPRAFLKEVTELRELGVEVGENIMISKNAHLILPYHSEWEKVNEKRLGSEKIGTTMRGIGPAYVDKMARCGIRVGDLLNESVLKAKIERNVAEKNIFLSHFGGEPIDPKKIFDEYLNYASEFESYIEDVSVVLNERIKSGQSVLFEGAQGALLDVDHGTYPFVTTSNSTVGGVCTGLGISPDKIDAVIGIAKAYTTRVGGGAFPSEIHDERGEYIREKGQEFGATTGRPRRCGWFDAVAVSYACRLNGLTSLVLTKSDVLDGIDEILVCVGYKYKGSILKNFPTESWVLDKVEPQYETQKGWKGSVTKKTEIRTLPQEFKDYVSRIEDLTETHVSIVSTGVERRETIFLERGLGGIIDLEKVRAEIN
ncbi:MAG: adenylosuccinate synthase [Candidatus Aminicenantes bacterium]|jgi:adenylosuccinate synthase